MRIGSLFSGYGGLDLAVMQVLGGEVAWHVEYDKAPSRILDHQFPGVPNYGDVTQMDFTTVEPVDVLTGGYPCQPFSHAGLRKGTNDERHLWPHVLRALRDLGPRFAVLENVRGHLSLGFDVVLSDLADIGWSAEWVVVRASDAGACHQRARLFILAYPGGDTGGQRPELPGVRGWSHQTEQVGLGHWRDASYPNGGRRQQPDEGERLLQLPNQDGHHAADAAGNRRPQRRTGPGERTGCCGQPACDCGAPADASGAGSRREPRDFPAKAGAGSAESRTNGRADGNAARGGGGAPADANLAGSQAWRDTGHDGERLRVEPLGFAQPPAHADEQGSQGSEPEGRHVVPARGAAAHASDGEQQIDQGHDGIDAEWSQGGRGTILAPWTGGDGVDPVGALAGSHAARGGTTTLNPEIDWGDYGPAIRRWEIVIGRPAPRPTEPGRTGAPRLAPRFVEWMMGLPDGWVTDPAIGISRNDQLKALGNGVVPQQAALALDVLLQRPSDDLRQSLAPL